MPQTTRHSFLFSSSLCISITPTADSLSARDDDDRKRATSLRHLQA